MPKSIVAIAALTLLYVPAIAATEAHGDQLRIAMGGLAFARPADGAKLR